MGLIDKVVQMSRGRNNGRLPAKAGRNHHLAGRFVLKKPNLAGRILMFFILLHFYIDFFKVISSYFDAFSGKLEA